MDTLLTLLLPLLLILPVLALGYDFTIEASEDTYVNEQHPTMNYGSEEYMRSGNVGECPTSEHISYVYFDLSCHGWDCFCSAELKVWCTFNLQPYPYSLFMVHMDEATWSEESITWGTKPDWKPGPIDEIVLPHIDGGEWVTFNVTEALIQWLSATNRGFCIRQDGTDLGEFGTKESGHAPQLRVWDNRGADDKTTGVESTSLGTIKVTFK